MKRIIQICFLFLVLVASAKAQFNFTFLPELYGRSVDGLGSFQLQNLGTEKVSGRVLIAVKENTSGSIVVTVATPFFLLNPGANNFQKSVFSNSAFRFSSNGYGAVASQTRSIPPGEYTYCFTFDPQDKTRFDEHENCFDGEIQPLVPLTLLNPAHLDTICTKRPILSWQPPMPFSAGMRFRLLLTEKKGDDSGVENMLFRTPLLLLDNISSTSINYPTANPELKEGKTYYWQVVAHEKGLIVSKSEIWEFTVQCKEPAKPAPADSYREIKMLMGGNYYIANRALKFSIRNDYNVQKLRYEILDIGNGSKAIKDIPEVKLQRGLNQVNIDLTELDLETGKQYLLKVYPFNETPLEIRFIYKDEDTELQ